MHSVFWEARLIEPQITEVLLYIINKEFMVQSTVSYCRLGSTETFTSNVEFRPIYNPTIQQNHNQSVFLAILCYVTCYYLLLSSSVVVVVVVVVLVYLVGEGGI